MAACVRLGNTVIQVLENLTGDKAREELSCLLMRFGAPRPSKVSVAFSRFSSVSLHAVSLFLVAIPSARSIISAPTSILTPSVSSPSLEHSDSLVQLTCSLYETHTRT